MARRRHFRHRSGRLARLLVHLLIGSVWINGGRGEFDEWGCVPVPRPRPSTSRSIRLAPGPTHRHPPTSVWPPHCLSHNNCQRITWTRRHTRVDGYNATTPQPKETSATKEILLGIRAAKECRASPIQLSTIRGSRDTGSTHGVARFSRGRVAAHRREHCRH